jgi:hypothetical protein
LQPRRNAAHGSTRECVTQLRGRDGPLCHIESQRHSQGWPALFREIPGGVQLAVEVAVEVAVVGLGRGQAAERVSLSVFEADYLAYVFLAKASGSTSNVYGRIQSPNECENFR